MPTQNNQRRRRLTSGQRRSVIVSGAIDEIAEKGYAGASMDDLAAAADVSKAVLYDHFSSKEELEVAMLEQVVANLTAGLARAVSAEAPAAERLRKGVDAFFAFVEGSPSSWRVLMRDATNEHTAAFRAQTYVGLVQAIGMFLSREPSVEQPADLSREKTDRLLAAEILGAAISAATWWTMHPDDFTRQQLVEEFMDFAWVGLERGIVGERYPRSAASEVPPSDDPSGSPETAVPDALENRGQSSVAGSDGLGSVAADGRVSPDRRA